MVLGLELVSGLELMLEVGLGLCRPPTQKKNFLRTPKIGKFKDIFKDKIMTI